MIHLENDYMEGAHPEVLARLVETNALQSPGYGLDDHCAEARRKICRAIGCPDAEVHFLVGGTQTNRTVIDALIRPWEGVLAAESGHIAQHEAGTIEAGGHKVLTLPHCEGKIAAEAVNEACAIYRADENREHMVCPGIVYISHPTEYGTIYSLSELEALSAVCRKNRLPLYLDGARLAYALASNDTDVTIKDIARLCDAFYIGGTKCGLLFGEAVVFTRKGLVSHFFTQIKQHGALLAKGRLLGVQFDALFTDDLYLRIGRHAIDCAERLKKRLETLGVEFYMKTPTNQQFIVLDDRRAEFFKQQAGGGFWERLADGRTVYRLATSWATDSESIDKITF